MRIGLLVASLLALCACAQTPPAPVGSSPSPPAVRTDRVGNVLPSVVPEETWRQLLARPIQLPSIAPGTPCPLTSTAQLPSSTGALAGSGPIYAVGNEIAYGSRVVDSLYPAKVLWVAAPDYGGPGLIRGRRLDGVGAIYFADSRRVTELRFEFDTRVRAAGSEHGWRYLPSTVNVEGPGCYGFQIDGPGWTTTIVMRAFA